MKANTQHLAQCISHPIQSVSRVRTNWRAEQHRWQQDRQRTPKFRAEQFRNYHVLLDLREELFAVKIILLHAAHAG